MSKEEREHFVISVRDRGEARFLLWFDDDEDGLVVDEERRLVAFEDAGAAAREARRRGLRLADEAVTDYDLGAIRSWAANPSAASIDPDSFLNAWNLFVDVARSIGDEVTLEALWGETSSALYQKVFWACNLPAITKPGEEVTPEWSAEDCEKLAAVFSAGLFSLDRATD